MDFSEPVAACVLKVGRFIQVIEFMKVCEYSMSRSFLTITKGYSHLIIETCFSQKPLGHFNQILYVSFWVHGNENVLT